MIIRYIAYQCQQDGLQTSFSPPLAASLIPISISSLIVFYGYEVYTGHPISSSYIFLLWHFCLRSSLKHNIYTHTKKNNINNFKSLSTKYQQKNKNTSQRNIHQHPNQTFTCTHTRMHTHAHAHAHIHTPTHARTHAHAHPSMHTNTHTHAHTPGIVWKLTCSVLQPVTLTPAHRALAAPSLLNTLNWTNPATNSPGKQEAEKVLSI